jgi:hypothetical protein
MVVLFSTPSFSRNHPFPNTVDLRDFPNIFFSNSVELRNFWLIFSLVAGLTRFSDNEADRMVAAALEVFAPKVAAKMRYQ